MSRRFANLGKQLDAPLPETDQPQSGDDNAQAEENAGALTEAAEGDAPEAAPEDNNDEPEKDEDMSEESKVNEARAEGRASAIADMTAVFASDLFPGREAAACKLLAKDMAPDDVIDLLADMPAHKPEMSDEQKASAEKAGREEMQSAMEDAGNADLGAGADEAPTSAAKVDSIWDHARAKNEKLKGS